MEENFANRVTIIQALEECKQKPKIFIAYACCILTLFLVHYFYFQTEMFSNYLGLLYIFALGVAREGYARSVKLNSRVNDLIEKMNLE